MEDSKHNFGNLALDKNMKLEFEFEVVEFEENRFVELSKDSNLRKEWLEKELKEELKMEKKLEFGLFEEFELKEKKNFQSKLKDCLLLDCLLCLEQCTHSDNCNFQKKIHFRFAICLLPKSNFDRKSS